MKQIIEWPPLAGGNGPHQGRPCRPAASESEPELHRQESCFLKYDTRLRPEQPDVKMTEDKIAQVVAEHLVNGNPIVEYTIGAAQAEAKD